MGEKSIIAEDQGEESVKSLWNTPFIFLVLISFITAMSFNMIYVIISKYAMGVTSSLTIAGFVAGVFSIAALIIRPFAGMTVDMVNKKTLCIIANVVIGVSVLGYAIFQNIPMLFFFRIVHGFAFGVSSTVNIALVAKYIPRNRIGEGLGYFGLGQVVAQVISPPMGVYIVDAYGFQLLFIVIALLSFIGAALLTLLRYPKSEKTEPKGKTKVTIHSLFAKEVMVFAAIGGMFSFGNGIVSSFLLLLGQERSIANISLFFSVGALVLFILRLFVGRIVDRKGLTLVVNVSLVVTAVSMFLIGVAPVLSLLLVAAVLKSIGQGAGQISLQTACIKRVDPSRVGVATSTFYIGADIGQGVGPMIGGAISASFGYTALFVVCAALMLISMIFFNLHQRKENTINKKSASIFNNA
ncbi:MULTISPECIES: MFS transporter [Bacillaceae]|uniref:MFS transporter n=1 Tax=Evansella alkalicola TaxID=745819 RepID=A0ABS6JMW4_9BACI|nr:MFS transporter [Litchfieldia alkalitelluris]MBU9719900.1 MFS transporter [Bacillus alkalicola]